MENEVAAANLEALLTEIDEQARDYHARQSARTPAPSSPAGAGPRRNVRTTAYTHTEYDHRAYANKTASGSTLRFGQVRSAAADWSRYPLGTTFRIVGQPYIYEIDDYGSALVGKNTIDLYRPSRASMNAWGAKNVEIEILEWGSFAESLKVMRPRSRAPHVRRMVSAIEAKLTLDEAPLTVGLNLEGTEEPPGLNLTDGQLVSLH
ncbi:MAG: 3D domain-containing protein [Verrucomicrobiales bacterium]